MDYDVVIIGAGVVGLACAYELSSIGYKTLVLEKHPSFGNETSSRNSEVIHSGIYYPDGSLKAKLCVEGKILLYDWCGKNNVPHNKIGKYIIAVNDIEEDKLDNLKEQAISNGVYDVSFIDIHDFNDIEPNIKASKVLYSPSTGIIDSHLLMESFEKNAIENGCDFAYKHEFINSILTDNGYELTIRLPDKTEFNLTTKYVINSAGLSSDLVAAGFGIDIEKYNYKLHYCRGHYFRLKSTKNNLVKHLIYPVPLKNLAGLGIHLTKELNGELKLGPDTEYLSENIQDYSISDDLHDMFFNVAKQYIKGIEYDDIYPCQSGIRPKLRAKNGEFRDFIISEESDKGFPGLINLIGIESPGLTCCISIAKYVSSFL